MPPQENTSPSDGADSVQDHFVTPRSRSRSGSRSGSAPLASSGAEAELLPEAKKDQTTADHMMNDASPAANGINGHAEAEKTSVAGNIDTLPPLPSIKSPLKAKNSVNGIEVSPPSKASIQSTANSVKDDKDIALLNEILQNTTPHVAQQVLRENWRAFLFLGPDSEKNSHVAFVLRAGLKHAPLNVLQHILDQKVLRPEILDIMSKRDVVIKKVLNTATSEQILNHAPKEVLDTILLQHLKHLPAKEIVKILAEAERLGYRSDDIIDTEDESVVPNISGQDEDTEMTDKPTLPPMALFRSHHGLPVPSTNLDLARPDTDPLLVEQERNAAILRSDLPMMKSPKASGPQSYGPLSCPDCHVEFPTYSGYVYHTHGKLCQKEVPSGGWKATCLNCFRGFTNKGGLIYHDAKEVCKKDIVPATSPSRQLQDEAAAEAQMSRGRPPQQYNPPYQPTPLPPPQPYPTPEQLRQSQSKPAVQKTSMQTPKNQRAEIHKSSLITRVQDSDSTEKRQHLSPSELSPAKLAEMNKQLAAAEVRYQNQIANVSDVDYPTVEEKAKRLSSLKATSATRMSQIRKRFGVTLRMREKDKKALSKQMRNSSPSTAVGLNLEQFRRTSAPGRPRINGTPTHSSSPLSGFSPVNAPRSGPPNGGHTPVPPSYESSAMSQPGSYRIPLPHKSPHSKNSPQLQPTFGNQLGSPSQPPAKRQRTTSPETSSSYFPPPGPGLNMVQVNSEDAAAHMARIKKIPVAQAQAKWASMQPKSSDEPRPADGPSDGAIVISSSESESEIEAIPKSARNKGGLSPDQPLPSVESANAEQSEPRRASITSPRGSLMTTRSRKN